MINTQWEAIVVGLGAMGSSTLYQLARRGVKVLGIDRYTPPHAYGSSHGETRVTRLAIGEGDQYVQLAKRSHLIWREVEEATGYFLLHQVGGLIFGTPNSIETHGANDFLADTIAAAKAHNIDHKTLNAVDLKTRYPQFRFTGNERGYYEPSAGYLYPELCIKAQLESAQGARIQTGEQLVSWEQHGDVVRLVTDKDAYETEKLILCCGPWLPDLVPELKQRLQILRQLLFWFELDGPKELFLPDQLPIYIRLPTDTMGMFYGFPIIDPQNGCVKVASEQYQDQCHPDAYNTEVTEDEIASMYELVSANLRISSRCVRAKACLYSLAPDFDFVIDHSQETDQVWFVSACSGHGFKHSAAIGEAMAAVITGHKPLCDLSPFSITRFKEQHA